MPRQFKTARLIKNLKVSDAIKLLGVSQPTLSAWESERKSPSIEKLELMADVPKPPLYCLSNPLHLKICPSCMVNLSGRQHMAGC